MAVAYATIPRHSKIRRKLIKKTMYRNPFYRIRWCEGYPLTKPRVVSMNEMIDSDEWDFPDRFLSNLEGLCVSEMLKFEDFSGVLIFERIDLDL